MPVPAPEGPIAALCLLDGVIGLGLAGAPPGQTLETMLVASDDARQGDLLLPSLQRLLDDAGVPRNALSGIAFDAGPGGFTRVRVACAVAQGVALGLALPVGCFDSLVLGARTAHRQVAGEAHGRWLILVLEDARMGEVYAAGFVCEGSDRAGESLLQPLGEPSMFRYEALAEWLVERVAGPGPTAAAGAAGLVLAGSGWDRLLPGSAQADEGLAQRLREAVPATASFERIVDAAHPDPLLRVQTLAGAARAHAQWLPPEQARPIYLRNKVALDIHEQAAARAQRG
ncbi:MAG: tRNA (adenosine(37)-N6)-threonylcarbamoyltransferase complex dimerization subunit type 1 TsaB [Burkholderiaceae bacterium]